MTNSDKNPLVFYKNYDYGTGKDEKNGPGFGLYENMDRYKSVDEFLKKKRKKNRKRMKMALLLAIASPESVKNKVYRKDKNDLQDPYENPDSPSEATAIPISPAEVNPIGIYDGILPISDLENRPTFDPFYSMTETHYFCEDGLENNVKPADE